MIAMYTKQQKEKMKHQENRPHNGIPHKNHLATSPLSIERSQHFNPLRLDKDTSPHKKSWLAGLVLCGYCGLRMQIIESNGYARYFLCEGRRRQDCFGDQMVHDVEKMEQAVTQALLEQIQRREACPSLQRDNWEHYRMESKRSLAWYWMEAVTVQKNELTILWRSILDSPQSCQ